MVEQLIRLLKKSKCDIIKLTKKIVIDMYLQKRRSCNSVFFYASCHCYYCLAICKCSDWLLLLRQQSKKIVKKHVLTPLPVAVTGNDNGFSLRVVEKLVPYSVYSEVQ